MALPSLRSMIDLGNPLIVLRLHGISSRKYQMSKGVNSYNLLGYYSLGEGQKNTSQEISLIRLLFYR